MADNSVKYTIQVTDNGSLKKFDNDVKDVNKNLKDANNSLRSFSAIRLQNISQAFQTISQNISSAISAINDLTGSYQEQIVAETQLQTVMNQRMGASAADVAAIKQLCAAQQQLGVIGDEVQLSGAQQMATFLNLRSSLDTLIPAMNNLIAQHDGLNATQQSATSIGNMMGKAMMGQTDVLKEVGITFTEAQAAVLKYGTEEERAAMLASVIQQNVGDMNAALAQTDAGQQKQLDNILGDIKESLGSCLQGMQPFIQFAGMAAMAAAGCMQFVTALKAVEISQSLVAAKTVLVTGAVKAWQAAQAVLNVVLSANPIGLVVMAIGALVAAAVAAYNNFQPFRDMVDKVWQAVRQLGSAVWNWLSPAFEKLGSVVKNVWDYLKQLFGFDDPASKTADSVRQQTKDVKALENAYTSLLDKKKKSAASSSQGTTGQDTYRDGSIGALEQEIQKMEDRLKRLTDQDKRIRLQSEIWVKKDSLNTVQKELDNVSKGLKLKTELKPVTTQANVLTTSLEKSDKGINGIAKRGIQSIKRYQEKYNNLMEGMENTARRKQASIEGAFSGIGDSFGALADATGQPIFAGISKGAMMAQAIAVMIDKLKTCVTVWDYIAAIGAGTASVISAFASMPAFANGGIIYGPTLGLMGEYSGAASNPEVVAPLDRLRGLITPNAAYPLKGEVQFHISGNALRGVLKNTERIDRLAGH